MLSLLCEATVRTCGLGLLVWLGFKVLRPANRRAELTAWTAILAASLLMPLLMQGPSLDLSVPIPAEVTPAASFTAPAAIADMTQESEAPAVTSLPWGLFALVAYLAIAAFMLLRLCVGLVLSERLRRAATPLPESAAHGLDIRASDAITAPMAFASTILVPRDYPSWPAFKRKAVLAHEAGHVMRGDFYVQVASALNRAIFWFSPLSWWLHERLAILAEDASDAAAIDTVNDPVVYAEVLFDFAQRSTHPLAGALPMARPNTVAQRIEHILSGQPLSRRIPMKKHLLIFASLLPLIALSAGVQIAATHSAFAAAPGQVRQLSAFHAVSFSSSGDVDISVGKAQAVSVEANADLLAHVTTEVRDGTLYIGRRNDDGDHVSGPLAVHISLPRLDGMTLSGSGGITINDFAGGATTVGISGSGSLSAKGRLDKLALTISGSGKADLPDLSVEDAAVKISGSGNVKIKANKSLDAQISGSGSVRYYGGPRVVSRVSGSGSIDRAD